MSRHGSVRSREDYTRLCEDVFCCTTAARVTFDPGECVGYLPHPEVQFYPPGTKSATVSRVCAVTRYV